MALRLLLLVASLAGMVVAQQQSGPWWLPTALYSQQQLQYRLPLNQVPLLGTHNSYNWLPPTANVNPLLKPTFNQIYSVSKQLEDFAIRYLELDVHYITSTNSQGQPYFPDPLVICHGSGGTYDVCYGSDSGFGTYCEGLGILNFGPTDTGCYYETTVTVEAQLQEVKNFLDKPGYTSEFIFVYIQWSAGTATPPRAQFTQLLNQTFGSSIFTPADLAANGGNWPSRYEMINSNPKKRIAFHSFQVNDGVNLPDLFWPSFHEDSTYAGFQPNYEQAAKFTGYPSCASTGYSLNPLPSDKFISFYEDRSYFELPGLGVVLNGSEGTGVFDAAKLIAAQNCGNPVRLDLADYDYLAGWVWSWEVNEPTYSNVAYIQKSGRWKADNTYSTSNSRPFVCRNITDGTFSITAATGIWQRGNTSCPPGTQFEVPRTALENEAVATLLPAGGTAWVRFSDWGFDGTFTDTTPSCGDGAANLEGEECDNPTAGSGCSASCTCTTGFPTVPPTANCVSSSGVVGTPPRQPLTYPTFPPSTTPPATTPSAGLISLPCVMLLLVASALLL